MAGYPGHGDRGKGVGKCAHCGQILNCRGRERKPGSSPSLPLSLSSSLPLSLPSFSLPSPSSSLSKLPGCGCPMTSCFKLLWCVCPTVGANTLVCVLKSNLSALCPVLHHSTRKRQRQRQSLGNPMASFQSTEANSRRV